MFNYHNYPVNFSDGGQMQFAHTPWQFSGVPQIWTTNGIQSPALLAPNPIFIRGQPDGTTQGGMFIQHSPQQPAIQQATHNRTYL